MNQKTLLLAVLGAAVLVTASVAGALTLGAGNAAAAGPSDSGQSITVSASGTVEAEPNQAILRVAVTASGDDASAVRDQLATDAEALVEALRDDGLSEDAIRTQYFDISPEHKRDGTTAETYRGIHAYEITLDDVDAAGEVIDLAVENGADRVMGVSFTLSEEKRDELHNEALKQAMGQAESRAGALASAGDLAVTGVHTIVSADTNYRVYRTEYAMTAGDAGGSTSIESGPVSVTANVRVTYNATSA